MKKLIIEQLKEGFIFIDEVGEKYAVSEGKISEKVKAYFGMTKRSDPEEAGEEENTHHYEDISRSSSTGRVEESDGNAQCTKQNDDTKLGTPDNYLVQSGQCAEILEKSGFDSPTAPLNYTMRPSDLQIPKFEYDKSKMQQYKSLSLQRRLKHEI